MTRSITIAPINVKISASLTFLLIAVLTLPHAPASAQTSSKIITVGTSIQAPPQSNNGPVRIGDETMRMVKVTHKEICEMKVDIVLAEVNENIRDAKDPKLSAGLRSASLDLVISRLKKLEESLAQSRAAQPNCATR